MEGPFSAAQKGRIGSSLAIRLFDTKLFALHQGNGLGSDCFIIGAGGDCEHKRGDRKEAQEVAEAEVVLHYYNVSSTGLFGFHFSSQLSAPPLRKAQPYC